MRALWFSLAVLGATALIQAVVAAISGSVALLGDTLHNAADALTAVPLAVAFVVGRLLLHPPLHLRLRAGRGPRRVVIVLFIAASSALAAYAAISLLPIPCRCPT